MKLLCLFLLIGSHAANAQVVSCASKTCIQETSHPIVEIVSATDLYSVRCCSEIQLPFFTPSTECPGLWVSSYDKGCANCIPHGTLTFAEAKSICECNGARLCTTTENLNDCTRDAECGLNELRVWAEFGDDAPSQVPATPTPTPAPIPPAVPPAPLDGKPPALLVPATPAPTPAPVPPAPPAMHDDPHIYTWQGNIYDYHGVCDMIYTTCPNYDQGKGFHMHVRTEFVEPTKWSTIASLAVKIGDDVLEVQNNGNHYLNLQANVDLSEGVDFAGHKLHEGYKFDNGRLRLLYEIELEDSSLLEILVKSPKNDGSKGDRSSLSFQIKGAHDHRNAGGNAFADCAGLSNTWVEPEEGKYLVGRSGDLFEYDRAHEFAPEWQVDKGKNDPMLFFEDVGLQLPDKECIKSPILVADHRHLSHIKNVNGGAVGRRAEQACSHVVNGDLYDACMFDVLITGDTSFAEEPWYN